MKKQIAFKANDDKQQYWLLDNQDVNFVENDTSIISTASKFIHEKYSKLDVHIKGTIEDSQLISDNGTQTLVFKVTVNSGDLPQGTKIAVAGMHYGKNPLNHKLIQLQKKGVFKKEVTLDFRGAAITYRLWKGYPLNRNFLMYDIGVNRSLPNNK